MNELGQQPHEAVVHRVTQRHTQQPGQGTHQHERQGVGPGHGALRQAEHPEHGAIVQMAGGVHAGGNRHRHRTQQGRQQGHQVEKFLGPAEGLLHLGPAGFKRFELGAAYARAHELGLGPPGVALHHSVVTSHHQPVAQPAGGLHEPGGREVVAVDHHPRGKAHETRAPVGLDDDDTVDAESTITQPERIAHRQVQRHQQRLVNPRAARGRHTGSGPFGGPGCGGHTQLPAQRVPVGHGLECHQPGGTAMGIVGAAHGGETHVLRQLQAQCTGLLGKGRWGGLVAAQHRVTTDELARVTGQATLQPVGKEPHGAERRHRQRDGQHQHPQLTGAPVAHERAPTHRPETCRHSSHAERLAQTLIPAPTRGYGPTGGAVGSAA